MAVILARDVETVGIRKAFRVAVGRAHDRNHRLALADLLSSQLHILWRQPRRVLAGALVAQQFFHGRRNQSKIGAQPLQFIGMAQQRQHPIANQVGGGFLAAHHGHDQVGDDLFFGQPEPSISAFIKAWISPSRGCSRCSWIAERK